MCQNCATTTFPTGLARRRLLRLAGVASVTATLPLVARSAFGQAPRAEPAKPQNVLTPDGAFSRLMKGNERYVEGVTRRHDFRSEREALARDQNPFAAILSCADSRIAPEYAFDSFRGDLFVVRVAGNFLNEDNLASFEYGVAVLGTPVLMVLGHGSCGAVSATIKAIKDNAPPPGHLPSLVSALTPAVRDATGKPGDLLENATKANIRLTVAQLKSATPILAKAVEQAKLRVVGGYYNLATGQVDIVA